MTKLERDHVERATILQRVADQLTRFIGRPAFLLTLCVGIILWISANLLGAKVLHRAIDPPPFNFLQTAAGVFALFFTVLIVSTQRRDDELADRREHLALQMAAITEQKIAKVIELLASFRHDAPALQDRTDDQAAKMANASGPQSVLDAIEALRSDTKTN